MIYGIIIILAYLLGSIPSGLIVGKLFMEWIFESMAAEILAVPILFGPLELRPA